MPENLDWKEGEQPNFWIYGNAGIYSIIEVKAKPQK